MKKRKNIITVAIDSPAAAGAGSQAKLIAKQYNLQHLDTGRIYRLIGKLKLTNNKNFTYSQIKKIIKNLKMKDLQHKNLLSDKVATSASIIAKDKNIRKIFSFILSYFIFRFFIERNRQSYKKHFSRYR